MVNGVVDAHHHIWRQADLPWLLGPMQPRIFGPYEPIRRDYPIEEYRDDIADAGIEKSVYVQANWPPDRAVDEVAWVQGEADRTGFPHAIVGYADFCDADVRDVLKAQRVYPLLRGIRMQLHWHENPQFRFAASSAVMNDATFRRNFGLLADQELIFELQLFTGQMRDGAAFAAAFPDVPMILAHCGMPEDLSAEGWRAWTEGMTLLAAEPNVFVKLSGLGTFIHALDPDHIARAVRDTIRLFGADRCLFGSNFPIEKLWTDYADLLSAYQVAVADLSEAEQQAIFNRTATRLYRL
jgi:predicted TIM-barrel fold metal-dependent hydrolase